MKIITNIKAMLVIICAAGLGLAYLPNKKATNVLKKIPPESDSSEVTSTSTTSINEIETTTIEIPTLEPTTIEDSEDAYRYRGFIFDYFGNLIISNENEYRTIIKTFKESLGNVFDGRSSLAVDDAFAGKTRYKNPTPTPTHNGYPMGQSIVLTIDANLHTKIYEYLKTNDIIGSVTVLDADGQVRVLASYPSYNANVSITAAEPHAYINRCVENAYPGSIFKILSGVVAADVGFLEYDDPGYIDNINVKNWNCSQGVGYNTPITQSLRKAILNSSNCFFATLFYNLGAERATQELDKFFLYEQEITCDFATMSNTINIETNDKLARVGFGQANETSPLYMAMCANGVVTGQLNKPYMLVKTVDTVTGKTIEELSNTETLNIIPDELTSEVKAGMKDVANDLGLTIPDERLNIYAKTGTAEINSDTDYHYIAIIVTNETNSVENTKAIVYQQTNSENAYASGDREHAQDILNIIYKEG